jgi:hypothetical protein
MTTKHHSNDNKKFKGVLTDTFFYLTSQVLSPIFKEQFNNLIL